jgi:hypothetical protein
MAALLDVLEFDARQRERQHDAAGKKHDVAREEVERSDVEPFADRDRTRRHHHQPERRQGGRGSEQDAVVATLDLFEAEGLAQARGDHQRTFNVARPISTSTTEMIQKRTITRGSGQPLSSKW